MILGGSQEKHADNLWAADAGSIAMRFAMTAALIDQLLSIPSPFDDVVEGDWLA